MKLFLTIVLLFVIVAQSIADTSLSGKWSDYYTEGDSYRNGFSNVIINAATPSKKHGAFLKTGLLTWDFKDATVSLLVKSSNWKQTKVLSLIAGNDLQFITSATIDIRRQIYEATDNEWIELAIPFSAWVVNGQLDWKNVDSFLIQVESESEPVVVSVKDVKIIKNKATRGVISITIDDGLVDTLVAAQELKKRKVPATIFIDHTTLGRPGYLNIDDVKKLAADGWDIGGHRIGKLSQLSDSEAELFFNNQASFLKEFSDYPIFAWPNGAYTAYSKVTIARYFKYAFSVAGYNNTPEYVFPYYINRHSIDKHTSLSLAKGWIDAAVTNNEWAIINFHSFSPNWEQEEDWAIEDFNALIEYAIQKNVQISTISEVLTKKVVDTNPLMLY